MDSYAHWISYKNLSPAGRHLLPDIHDFQRLQHSTSTNFPVDNVFLGASFPKEESGAVL